jgi:hypothetical protein
VNFGLHYRGGRGVSYNFLSHTFQNSAAFCQLFWGIQSSHRSAILPILLSLAANGFMWPYVYHILIRKFQMVFLLDMLGLKNSSTYSNNATHYCTGTLPANSCTLIISIEDLTDWTLQNYFLTTCIRNMWGMKAHSAIAPGSRYAPDCTLVPRVQKLLKIQYETLSCNSGTSFISLMEPYTYQVNVLEANLESYCTSAKITILFQTVESNCSHNNKFGSKPVPTN